MLAHQAQTYIAIAIACMVFSSKGGYTVASYNMDDRSSTTKLSSACTCMQPCTHLNAHVIWTLLSFELARMLAIGDFEYTQLHKQLFLINMNNVYRHVSALAHAHSELYMAGFIQPFTAKKCIAICTQLLLWFDIYGFSGLVIFCICLLLTSTIPL